MSELAEIPQQLRNANAPGYVKFPGFAGEAFTRAMLDDVIAMARAAAEGRAVDGALVMPEAQTGMTGTHPEDLVSKIFRLHRRPVFQRFLADPRLRDIVVAALGADVDCFLSQFIFKNPGAWGQPWHQDSYYFPFTPARPVVGLWLAITEATLQNGCLHVLPGSQAEPVHEHIPDRRPSANQGYVEIVDHDISCIARPTTSPMASAPPWCTTAQRREPKTRASNGPTAPATKTRSTTGCRIFVTAIW